MSRPRVLVIAEAANPEWVSVPLVGWSLARALAQVADTHLVTQVRNRDAILRAGLVEGRDFTAIDSEALARPAWRLAEALGMAEGKGQTILQALNALTYPQFERLVWRRFGDALRAGEFDLVHRVTPLSPTAPSPIARRCRRLGIPFVMGPLNGGVPWPPGFEAEMRREREGLSRLRGLHKLLPGREGTLASASAIIAGSRFTLSEVPARHRGRTFWLPENAVDPARFARRTEAPGDGPLRACFIGRLVPFKGVDMLLEAAAPMLGEARLRLDIIGDGPERPALEAQAAAAGLGAAARFHGWVPHQEVQDIAATAQVLAFPSIRDFGGGAVLEAMALGLVPVVLDYAGPAELVTAETGVKVPMGDRAAVVAGLRAALEALAADRTRVAAMGQAARARVERHFTWDRKAAQVAQVYRWVLCGGPKPDLFAGEAARTPAVSGATTDPAMLPPPPCRRRGSALG